VAKKKRTYQEHIIPNIVLDVARQMPQLKRQEWFLYVNTANKNLYDEKVKKAKITHYGFVLTGVLVYGSAVQTILFIKPVYV
jgi:hypothetical protein